MLVCFISGSSYAAGNLGQPTIAETVDATIKPLVQKYNIPGMAIAITVDGKNYFYNYGVASKETKQAITNATLFEIGSMSKTFTATLASSAQVDGKLSFSDNASKYLPALRGSSFDNISLLNLGTHTSGGLPLQFPDDVQTNDQLFAYYKNWKPDHPAGTYRTYSNPSIGMLGMITAKSMNISYDDAIEKKLFPALGIKHSYINVPANQMKYYAQGYTKTDAPVRLNPGILSSEAYGVKSNTVDMIRFVEANMQVIKLDQKLQRAINDTHTGYFKAGGMTQDLIWEQYPQSADLNQVLEGNSDAMVYNPTKVTEITPPLAPQKDVYINKTGSTNGFGGYVAFIPASKIGIVILANKNYPVDARVTAAYQILSQLKSEITQKK
nr:class C beta-lactamase [Glaciimonas soli]